MLMIRKLRLTTAFGKGPFIMNVSVRVCVIVNAISKGRFTVSGAISVTLFIGTMQINDTIQSEQFAFSDRLIAKSHMGVAPIFSVEI